jgi:hypothetical protein
MKALPTQFEQNADQLGRHVFKQIKRAGNVYIYQRNKADGSLFGWEVFVADSTTFTAIGAPPGDAREVYPRANAFGKTAWFCATLERAEARFKSLTTP